MRVKTKLVRSPSNLPSLTPGQCLLLSGCSRHNDWSSLLRSASCKRRHPRHLSSNDARIASGKAHRRGAAKAETVGLTAIARRVHGYAKLLERELSKVGVAQRNEFFFDTLRLEPPSGAADRVREAAVEARLNFRYRED